MSVRLWLRIWWRFTYRPVGWVYLPACGVSSWTEVIVISEVVLTGLGVSQVRKQYFNRSAREVTVREGERVVNDLGRGVISNPPSIARGSSDSSLSFPQARSPPRACSTRPRSQGFAGSRRRDWSRGTRDDIHTADACALTPLLPLTNQSCGESCLRLSRLKTQWRL